MFLTANFQGRIVHRDKECIIIDIYKRPPNNFSYLGQLLFSVTSNIYSYNLYGYKESYELNKEIADGLTSLMEKLRSLGLYPLK